MKKLGIEDLEVQGKRVLMRVDFNVPIKENRVSDDTRILAAIPTIQALRDKGASVVLMSHLGRPKGTRDERFTLEPVARRLARHLDSNVRFVDDCVGEAQIRATKRLEPGDVMLLENLRFHAEEEANDPTFADQLSQMGDVYVNDAFGTAHRAHASTEAVARCFRQAAAGLLLKAELETLAECLESPQRPFVAVLGGAKISGKIDVIQNLLGLVDQILIGGGMAYTFYQAMDIPIGDSLVERDRIEMAGEILQSAQEQGVEIILPVDSVVSTAADGSEPCHETMGREIPEHSLGVDIGPKNRELFCRVIGQAQTLVWNGPLGVFEVEALSGGTKAVAACIAEAKEKGATTIVGGGDSIAALAVAGLTPDHFSHVSTGGGAFLEFLEGKTLPGVAALTDK